MNRVEEATEQLLGTITGSFEYTQFQNLQDELLAKEELYRKFNEYRKKKFEIQTTSDDCMEPLRNLSGEYASVLEEGLVKEFIMAEQRFCRMMRKINDSLTNGLGMDICFLEEQD